MHAEHYPRGLIMTVLGKRDRIEETEGWASISASLAFGTTAPACSSRRRCVATKSTHPRASQLPADLVKSRQSHDADILETPGCGGRGGDDVDLAEMLYLRIARVGNAARAPNAKTVIEFCLPLLQRMGEELSSAACNEEVEALVEPERVEPVLKRSDSSRSGTTTPVFT